MRKIRKIINNIFFIVHKKSIKKKYSSIDKSIISQNCVGGLIYNMLSKEFLSPTINVFIEDENFVKICLNPIKYFSVDAVPYVECYVDPVNSSISYPKIKVLDVEICAMHFKNCNEACEAWNRRRKRFKFQKYVIIANTWNLHGRRDLIEKVLSLPNSIMYGNLPEYSCHENYIYLNKEQYKFDDRGIVRPDLVAFSKKKKGYKNFEYEFDIWNWLYKS